MEGKRLIRSIRLENLLSYGPDSVDLPLESLNVLIGPNGSGKSNLIEALSLLQATPRDLQEPIRAGGGVGDWIWKGGERGPTATLDVTVDYPSGRAPLRYRLSFRETAPRFELREEVIENEENDGDDEQPYPGQTMGEIIRAGYGIQEQTSRYYVYSEGRSVLDAVVDISAKNRLRRYLQLEEVSLEQSILSQRRDPDSYPELTYLARQFERMSFYREWNLGRDTPPRRPQQADLPGDSLLENASNLGLVLNALQNRPEIKKQILERLRTFYEPVRDITTTILGGTVQIFFHEEGLSQPIPATRLSDGTLRYLCLVVVLCHPEPPPVICLEEPELGLHPDVIPEVAKMLVEASARSQLFVTTHSDILIDALTETPEAILVCEKEAGATKLHRLTADELEPWLDKYRLGELWTRGELGGNRW